MITGAAPRHAVYWAPPFDHPLWTAGCHWLGRDAREGQPLLPAARSAVAAPWRYGFHATLKAPMALADGASTDDWLSAVRQLAARHAAFTMPPLQVDTLSDFIALRPVHRPEPDHALRRLADACVVELDSWRAPQTAADRARLEQPHFSERQRQQLARWGYAHVLGDWRLHLTLSNGLQDVAALAALKAEAVDSFAAALREPLRCDAICVYTEAAPGQPFVLSHRFPLGDQASSQVHAAPA